jgi:hypothetical protein
MSTITRLKCDKCEGESPLYHYGTPTDARVSEFKYGWFYDFKDLIATDLCPVCSGRDPDYWHHEPF